jgi:hypothetical protein
MATAESGSVRLFWDKPPSGATAIGVNPWPGWKRLPDSLEEFPDLVTAEKSGNGEKLLKWRHPGTTDANDSSRVS